MSNYEIELQVQGSPSGELTQQVDGEPGGGSVSAREAEAWARGTRAGTAVSSDDPTYHNNSKYYAEQAHDAAESASAAYGTNLLAPTFDASQAYPAGAHVIHDGGYYVLPEGHTAGDTWAETSKTQQTVGGEVTGLKSAINESGYLDIKNIIVASESVIDTSLNINPASSWRMSEPIPVKNGYSYHYVCTSESGKCAIAKSDSSGNLISLLQAGDSTGNYTITVDFDGYVVLCYKYTSVPSFLEYYDVVTKVNAINEDISDLQDGVSEIAEIIDETIHDAGASSLYQAVITNALNENIENTPIKIKCHFNKGECLSEENIVVYKGTAGGYNPTTIEFQWEDEKDNNYYRNHDVSRYNDNSLKNGYIWIIDDINALAQNVYSIVILPQKREAYNPQITHSTGTTAGGNKYDKFSCDDVVISFGNKESSTGAYSPRSFLKNNVEFLQTNYGMLMPILYNAQGSYKYVFSDTTNYEITATITGKGIVFVDYTVVATSANDKITCVYRIFNTGRIEIIAMFIAKGSETLYGFGAESNFKQYGSSSIQRDTNTWYMKDTHDGGDTATIKILNSILNTDIITTDTTFTVAATTTSEGTERRVIRFAWTDNNGKSLVKNSAFYLQGTFDINQSVNALSVPLCATAAKYPVKVKKKQLKEQIETLIEFLYIYNMHDMFPGCAYGNDIMYSMMTTGTVSESKINQYISALNTSYNNCTKEGFYSAWQNGRSVAFIGRDTSSILEIKKICDSLNYSEQSARLVKIIHAQAQFYTLITSSVGEVYLAVNGTISANGEATGLKAYYNSLQLEENETIRSYYTKVYNRLYNVGLKYNMSFSYQSNGYMEHNGNILHYAAFTIFDLVEAVPSIGFNISTYAEMVTAASGMIEEIGFTDHSNRFGVQHSYSYLAYLLIKYGSVSSMECASRLLDNFINQCYPTGTSLIPLDGWKLVEDSGFNVPIAISALYKAYDLVK